MNTNTSIIPALMMTLLLGTVLSYDALDADVSGKRFYRAGQEIPVNEEMHPSEESSSSEMSGSGEIMMETGSGMTEMPMEETGTGSMNEETMFESSSSVMGTGSVMNEESSDMIFNEEESIMSSEPTEPAVENAEPEEIIEEPMEEEVANGPEEELHEAAESSSFFGGMFGLNTYALMFVVAIAAALSYFFLVRKPSTPATVATGTNEQAVLEALAAEGIQAKPNEPQGPATVEEESPRLQKALEAIEKDGGNDAPPSG